MANQQSQLNRLQVQELQQSPATTSPVRGGPAGKADAGADAGASSGFPAPGVSPGMRAGEDHPPRANQPPTATAVGQPASHPGHDQYGEGNYTAAKVYDDGVKRFVESGRVEQAAKDAEPRNDDERVEMEEAEQVGRDRAREEDTAVSKKTQRRSE